MSSPGSLYAALLLGYTIHFIYCIWGNLSNGGSSKPCWTRWEGPHCCRSRLVAYAIAVTCQPRVGLAGIH